MLVFEGATLHLCFSNCFLHLCQRICSKYLHLNSEVSPGIPTHSQLSGGSPCSFTTRKNPFTTSRYVSKFDSASPMSRTTITLVCWNCVHCLGGWFWYKAFQQLHTLVESTDWWNINIKLEGLRRKNRREDEMVDLSLGSRSRIRSRDRILIWTRIDSRRACHSTGLSPLTDPIRTGILEWIQESLLVSLVLSDGLVWKKIIKCVKYRKTQTKIHKYKHTNTQLY